MLNNPNFNMNIWIWLVTENSKEQKKNPLLQNLLKLRLKWILSQKGKNAHEFQLLWSNGGMECWASWKILQMSQRTLEKKYQALKIGMKKMKRKTKIQMKWQIARRWFRSHVHIYIKSLNVAHNHFYIYD